MVFCGANVNFFQYQLFYITYTFDVDIDWWIRPHIPLLEVLSPSQPVYVRWLRQWFANVIFDLDKKRKGNLTTRKKGSIIQNGNTKLMWCSLKSPRKNIKISKKQSFWRFALSSFLVSFFNQTTHYVGFIHGILIPGLR